MKFVTLTVAAASLVGSTLAFAPTEKAKFGVVANAFANGLVGGEGPEPMPFTTAGTSVNFDPAGFTEVSVTFLRV
jgi:hypothetical protein